MRVDVGEENLGSFLDDINQLVDARPASLAFPVQLIQEERLQEFLPQLPAPQHRHGLLRKPGNKQHIYTHMQIHVAQMSPSSSGEGRNCKA